MSSDAKTVVEGSLTAQIRLYYDLQLGPQQRAPLLIGLHGYGAYKAQMMREAQQMAPKEFAIASLQGFHQHLKEPREPGGPLRYGFGWLSNYRAEESVAIHHQAVLDLIAALSKDGVVDPARVFLLGFSQSCALNYRFAFTHAGALRGVIGICGGIPGDWETNPKYRRTEAAVFHLTGTQDTFYPTERVARYREQLSARSANVKFKSYDAAHEIVPEMRDDIRAWLSIENSKI